MIKFQKKHNLYLERKLQKFSHCTAQQQSIFHNFFCCIYGQLESIKHRIEEKSDVNQKKQHTTPIHQSWRFLQLTRVDLHSLH